MTTTARAVADSTGVATFTFVQVQRGVSWVATVSVTTTGPVPIPSSVVGSVLVTSIPFTPIYGGGPAGPVAVRGSGFLSITMTGLTAGQQYLAVATYTLYQGTLPPATEPTALAPIIAPVTVKVVIQDVATAVFGRKVELAGTGATTPVPILAADEHFTTNVAGILIIGTTTNKGKRIWLSNKPTGFSTNFFSFPAKGGVAIPFKKDSKVYLAGTAGDFAWVLSM